MSLSTPVTPRTSPGSALPPLRRLPLIYVPICRGWLRRGRGGERCSTARATPRAAAPARPSAPLIYAFAASPEKEKKKGKKKKIKRSSCRSSLSCLPPRDRLRGAAGGPCGRAAQSHPRCRPEREGSAAAPLPAPVPLRLRGSPGPAASPLPPPAPAEAAGAPRRSGAAPAPRFACGRGVSRGAPNNKDKFESSRRRTGCSDVREQCCASRPAPRPPPLKGAGPARGARRGAPAAGGAG